jgi:hypothetical protein
MKSHDHDEFVRIICKECGKRLEYNRESGLWHCTNNDMSHRKLLPNGLVQRALRALDEDEWRVEV